MGIFELFSRRQAELRREATDVYTYDVIPLPLRTQIVHILKDALGDEEDDSHPSFQVAGTYEFIVNQLCREYGVFELSRHDKYGDHIQMTQLFRFILDEQAVDKVLDAVELSARFIENLSVDFDYRRHVNAKAEAAAAIQELNERFRLAAVGYRIDSGQIIRVDSELVHASVVKPALALLRNKQFAGAESEFLSAHEHMRHGRQKEALVDCVKALESTLKIIAAKRNWSHDPKAAIKELLKNAFDNGLIPPFWDQHFSSFRAMLESGVPTARNRGAGHGQGLGVTAVPDSIATFALNQTAAVIVYLVTSDSELP